MRLGIVGLQVAAIVLLTSTGTLAEDLLLEDYEEGGVFRVTRFDNSFGDSNGRKNSSRNSGSYATVNWAAKWSGLESTGKSIDLGQYETFQVDVMVKPGQPVEAETNFYFQLLHKTEIGFAYWEYYVAQTSVPADGNWYRIRFPFNKFSSNAGNGASKPTNFATVVGTVCGMTYDETGDVYKHKAAHFDNVYVSREMVDDVEVKRVSGRTR